MELDYQLMKLTIESENLLKNATGLGRQVQADKVGYHIGRITTISGIL